MPAELRKIPQLVLGDQRHRRSAAFDGFEREADAALMMKVAEQLRGKRQMGFQLKNCNRKDAGERRMIQRTRSAFDPRPPPARTCEIDHSGARRPRVRVLPTPGSHGVSHRAGV